MCFFNKVVSFVIIGVLMSCSAAFAQSTSGKVPDPAHPAPANPKATDGMSTEAPAKGDSMKKGGDMGTESDGSMKKKM